MASLRNHPAIHRPRRALRVGVLLGDQLVEERIFAGQAPVRIGQSLRCDLSLPVDALPQEHVLFAFEHGQRQLRITAAMNGRLAQGTTIRTTLRDGASNGGVWTLPLEQGARGRIEIGEASILFQEIALAPVAPRPQLPASIRGTFVERVDRRLAVIVGASLMAHVAIGTWASLVDREIADEVAQVNQEFEHRTIVENPVFPEVPAAPSSSTSTEPTPSTPALPAAAPVPTARPPASVGKRPRPSVPSTMPEADAALLAQLMTSGMAPDGQPGGMSNRKPQTDLQKEIDDAKHRDVSVGNDQGGFRKDRAPQIGTSPNRIVTDPLDIIQTPDKVERPVRIHPVPMPPGPEPEPTLTADMIVTKIKNHYMSGLQRCYRKGLATDATLRGTLKLSFTVDESGRVTDGEAVGLTSQVSSCVEDYMESWRFAVPKDRVTGEPTEAPVKVSLAMQPS